jgi:hypothetical protein
MLHASGFFDTIRTGILVQDASGDVVDYNAAAVRLLGLGAEQLGAFDPWRGAVLEDGTPFLQEQLPTAVTLRTGETQLDVVIGVDLSGQIRRWLSVDTYLLTVDDTVTGVVAAFDDIDTQWHERHLLKLLAEVNRVVMSSSSEAESLEHLCTTLVEKGPFPLAWIGMADRSEDDLIHVTYSAGATGYLYTGMASWSDG